MNLLLYLVVLAVAGSLVAAAYNYHKRYYVLPYLYFVRFPALVAVGLFAFPIVANWFAPTMLKNAFEVNQMGVLVIGFLGAYGVFSVLYNLTMIWRSVPLRCGLLYERSLQRSVSKGQASMPPVPGRLLSWRSDVASLVLLFPCVLVVTLNCEDGAARGAVFSLVGVGLAFGLRHLLSGSLTRVTRKKTSTQINRGVRRLLSSKSPGGLKGFLLSPLNGYRLTELHLLGNPSTLADIKNWIAYLRLHLRALVFFASWIVVYVIGFFAKPTYPVFGEVVPALAYVIVLATALTWLSSFLCFTFDSSRLPVLSVVLVFFVGLNLVVESDHMYRVIHREAPVELPSVEDAFQAVEDRLASPESPMIVVAASGGGITASLWTTTVLDGLARAVSSEVEGMDLHEHVAAVSSVSGGSVGAIHYLNTFRPGGVKASDVAKAVEASASSSLAAATWGMAYLDFFRMFTGTLLGTYDRARVQEEVWDRLLHENGPGRAEDLRLGDWAARVAAGELPIPFLNATLEESGERLVLSPVSLPLGLERGRVDFFGLLPSYDVRATTAARLSATFPYVTPQARPDIENPKDKVAYHAADGGFYDNSGIVTLLDGMDLWLKSRAAGVRRKVILIEIRAGTTPPEQVGVEPGRRAFVKGLTGPLSTMFAVRTSSQLARNRFEVELFAEAWEDVVDLQHYSFELGGDTPLSWHLSRENIETIKSYWPAGGASLMGLEPGERRRVLEHNAEQLAKFLESVGGGRD